MRINVSIEGKKRGFDKWIDGISKKNMIPEANTFGRNLCASLQRHSPKDTHEMANSWDYTCEKSSKGVVDINITNNSHPETPRSVPELVHYGHGLKGGGYVRANPFITRAVNSIYDAEVTKILGSLLDGR